MEKESYLECEKWYIFILLTLVGGFFGAYTYVLKGGVFCNAQTANIVLLGIALGNLDFSLALHLFSSLIAYMLGIMLSEHIALKIKKINLLRWDTLLVALELLLVVILAFLPENTPYQVYQISINFMCAMQFNTFRQAQGVAMATTFVTNHIRQTGSFFVRWFRKKEEKEYLRRTIQHGIMILAFMVGAIISTLLAHMFGTVALLGAGVVLVIVLINLLYADLVKEKDLLYKVPKGH